MPFLVQPVYRVLLMPSFRSLIVGFLLITVVGCSPTVPEHYQDEPRIPKIDPDYTSLTIPPNIAPLNFRIEESGAAFLVRIASETGPPLLLKGPSIDIPVERWKKLLADNHGNELRVDVFVQNQAKWKKYGTIVHRIATEPIDSFVAYRLLEPVFEKYRDISLRQRNLENFDEHCFYDNQRMVGDKGQCANCHAFQNYRTENMMFHTRQYRSGTVFLRDGVPSKVDLSFDHRAIAGATYPAWHPTRNLVAFSVNKTSQHFHTVSAAKVEVLDIASDLVLYDVDRNEMSYILLSADEFETYPAWSPDGNRLYYCNAKFRLVNRDFDNRREEALQQSDKIRYDLMQIPFDRQTGKFGTPKMLVDAASQKKNVTFPRPSPDGRYVMYCLSDSGCFSIWHRETDLWIHDLQSGESRPLTEVNSTETESFHCWSSNGRWFVFSSRRDDGLYTRLYLSHFDEQGRASKPFVLPQRRPEHDRDLMKSYNVPELTVEPIRGGFRSRADVVQGEP